jgi:acetoin utilization deacetylase AcuC-like enzyme
MTLLYQNPLFLQHQTGRHPECPARLEAIAQYAPLQTLAARCQPGTFQPAKETTVALFHDPRQVLLVKNVAGQGGGMLEMDTVLSPDSYDVAMAAVGVGMAAVDAVLAGQERNALCLVRPPGHHATPLQSMGFCLFNNIALAALHAVKQRGLNRVLIVDWDVHHGNGTQDFFYEDPQICFFSIHRYPFYPGTGRKDETGRGPGLGNTFNAPIRFGSSREDYFAAFAHLLEKAADHIKPELILISAGFDAHAEDPIGSLGLEVEDFTRLSELVLEVAKTHAQGRMVSFLEGGYNLQRLSECVTAHLEVLLKG